MLSVGSLSVKSFIEEVNMIMDVEELVTAYIHGMRMQCDDLVTTEAVRMWKGPLRTQVHLAWLHMADRVR